MKAKGARCNRHLRRRPPEALGKRSLHSRIFTFVLNSHMAKGTHSGMDMGGTHHGGSMHDMGDTRTVWTINGDSYPRTPTVSLKTGQVYRLRFQNEDQMQLEDNMTHPIHIHGAHFEVLSLNGSAPPREMFKDTLEVAPNEYADIAVRFSNPGQWMLHCHIIDHEDNGMMMMLDVR